MSAKNKVIHTRGLTSFFTVFGFVIMAITGLVLYIVPAGRIAYWIEWQFLGLTKPQWDSIHILSSILFLVAGIFHMYFNWKPLMNYFRDRLTKGIKLRRELAISLAVSVWLVISALFAIPPLSYLLDLNEYVKAAWIVQDEYEPPFGHAEMLSLRVFCKKMDIDLETAIAELRQQGIQFEDADETLEDIGAGNNTAPMNIYLLIKKHEPAPEPEKLGTYTPESIEVEFAGAGIGNKSVSAVCERLGLETGVALNRLTGMGISAAAEKTLKSIAEDNGTAPLEIMKAMLIEGYTPAAGGD